MKEKITDKIKRGLKKIEDISDKIEKVQNLQNNIIDTVKSKIDD